MKLYSLLVIIIQMPLLISIEIKSSMEIKSVLDIPYAFTCNVLAPLPKPSNTIDFTDPIKTFKMLCNNEAILLKKYVGKEQGGQYCLELHKVESIIQQAFVINNGIITSEIKEEFNTPQLEKNPLIKSFLFNIAKKQSNLEAFIEAIEKKDFSSCIEILEENRYVANAYSQYDYEYEYKTIPPLHYLLYEVSAKRISKEEALIIATILLRHGANSNAMDKNGKTPLHIIPSSVFVGLLLEYGADTKKKNNKGLTPLMFHTLNEKYHIIKKLYIDKSDLNEQDNLGDTALHIAAEVSYIPAIKLFLQNEASYCITNNFGQRPCDVARDKAFEIIQKHIQLCLCHALQDNSCNRVDKIVALRLPISYTINGMPIIKWAQRNCKDNDNNLFASVFTFNGLLQEQFAHSRYLRSKNLIEEISINMINKTRNLLLSQILRKKHYKKAKVLLKNGAIVTQKLLKKNENTSIYDALKNSYEKQMCFQCPQSTNLITAFMLTDREVFVTCVQCKPKNAQYI